MLGVLLKISVPLLLLLQCRDVDGSCKAISAQDIDDAAQLSKQSYGKKLWELWKSYGDLKKGQTVSHTSGYVVDDVFTGNLEGQGLKVVIASKQSPKTTIISYRGTTTAAQLLDQFKSGAAEKWKILEYPGNMKVMQYTWDAVNKLDVLNKMTFDSGTRYIITGHSLGGAMATLLAIQLHFHDNQFWSRDNSLITFAAPRVGNGQFAKEHDRLISPRKKLRIVYRKDAVPHVPPLSLGYKHVSTEIFITAKTSSKTSWEKCGFRNRFRCPKVEIHKDYNWEVCPLKHGLFTCSKKYRKHLLLGYSVLDHAMDLYLAAADNLNENENKEEAKEFYMDQCSN